MARSTIQQQLLLSDSAGPLEATTLVEVPPCAAPTPTPTPIRYEVHLPSIAKKLQAGCIIPPTTDANRIILPQGGIVRGDDTVFRG